ncbi:hypothetical protein SAMN06265370_108151 [Puniceibacterium sediminis]|uniref:Uncharacterized protein n=1 Tax=Puniceibacterium sediminis TaxID=1608407 RepID=A0A238X0B0_9RHOB|nr:hypothetical protein SAMN06265370_108151 [Puniceibacterium sediminis]
MEQKQRPPKTPKDHRDARLKSALKANLARRKAQSRARTGEKPQPEGAEKDKG